MLTLKKMFKIKSGAFKIYYQNIPSQESSSPFIIYIYFFYFNCTTGLLIRRSVRVWQYIKAIGCYKVLMFITLDKKI